MNRCPHSIARILSGCMKLVMASLVLALGWAAFRSMQRLGQSPSWALGELLINYAGGPVRRGLIGQLLGHSATPLRTAAQVQRMIVAVFVVGSAGLVLTWRRLSAALAFVLLLCFAPGGLFQMAAGGGSYTDRKEMWFYAGLIVMAFAIRRFGLFRAASATVLGTLCAILILHHEAFAVFYLPPLALCFVLHAAINADKRSWCNAACFALPPLLACVFVLVNPGDKVIATAIIERYAGTDAESVRGGITAIGWDFDTTRNLSIRMLAEGSGLYWLTYLLSAVALAALCLACAAPPLFSHVLYWGVLIWHLVAAGVLAHVGWDWGRWISMYGIGCALLFVLLHNQERHTTFTTPEKQAFWLADTQSGKRPGMGTLLALTAMALPALLLNMTSRMALYGPQPATLTLSWELWNRVWQNLP